MSNLLNRYRTILCNTGFSPNIFLFLFFVIVWVLGATCGVLSVVIGMDLLGLEGEEESELDEMIARMNEEGPNN